MELKYDPHLEINTIHQCWKNEGSKKYYKNGVVQMGHHKKCGMDLIADKSSAEKAVDFQAGCAHF